MNSNAGCAPASGYQGWSNYETWLVWLWLGNEEISYRYWRAVAREQQQAAPRSDYVRNAKMSVAEAAACLLADELRTTLETQMPDCGATLYADLLTGALAEVDWLSITTELLEELE